jgi:hypothetical protein
MSKRSNHIIRLLDPTVDDLLPDILMIGDGELAEFPKGSPLIRRCAVAARNPDGSHEGLSQRLFGLLPLPKGNQACYTGKEDQHDQPRYYRPSHVRPATLLPLRSDLRSSNEGDLLSA